MIDVRTPTGGRWPNVYDSVSAAMSLPPVGNGRGFGRSQDMMPLPMPPYAYLNSRCSSCFRARAFHGDGRCKPCHDYSMTPLAIEIARRRRRHNTPIPKTIPMISGMLDLAELRDRPTASFTIDEKAFIRVAVETGAYVPTWLRR